MAWRNGMMHGTHCSYRLCAHLHAPPLRIYAAYAAACLPLSAAACAVSPRRALFLEAAATALALESVSISAKSKTGRASAAT